MSAAKNERYGRFAERCDHLRDGKSGFHIAAYGMKKDQDPFNLIVILDQGEAVHRTLQGRLADLGG